MALNSRLAGSLSREHNETQKSPMTIGARTVIISDTVLPSVSDCARAVPVAGIWRGPAGSGPVTFWAWPHPVGVQAHLLHTKPPARDGAGARLPCTNGFSPFGSERRD